MESCPSIESLPSASEMPVVATTPLLSTRCKRFPRYQQSSVKSKTVIVLLLWNLCVSAGPGFIKVLLMLLAIFSFSNRDLDHFKGWSITFGALAYMVLCLLYPLCGMIADICIGRYRTVLFSMLLILLTTATAVVLHAIALESKDYSIFYFVPPLPFMILGLAGFQSNVVQFATDQIHEAPSGEWCNVVRWFVWSSVLGREAIEMIFLPLLICQNQMSFHRLGFMFALSWMSSLCVLYFALMIIVCAFSKRFNSIPKFPNPYKSLFGVLNFARKHRFPIRQSAVTDWDDRTVSRFDYAKQKFGGPFSNESVDDVKTFFRILLVIFLMASIYLIRVANDYSLETVFGVHLNLYYLNIFKNSSNACNIENPIITGKVLLFFLMVFIMIVYESLVYPFFGSYFPNALKTTGIGMLLSILSSMIVLAVDTVGHTRHPNVTCMFLSVVTGTGIKLNSSYAKQSLELSINPSVIIVVDFINIVTIILIHTSALKFILAQSPQMMKGMIIGLFSFFDGFFNLVGSIIMQVFYAAYAAAWKRDTPLHTQPSCGTVYYLTNTLIASAALVLFIAVARRYRYRERGS